MFNPKPILNTEDKFCSEDESYCNDNYPGGHYHDVGFIEYFCPGGEEND